MKRILVVWCGLLLIVVDSVGRTRALSTRAVYWTELERSLGECELLQSCVLSAVCLRVDESLMGIVSL